MAGRCPFPRSSSTSSRSGRRRISEYNRPRRATMKLAVLAVPVAAVVVVSRCVVPSAQAPSAGGATFTKDVAPIFQKACQNCHRPGSIAPMSLLTYEDARPWARSIKDRVERRSMPPWHVDRTVGIRKFKDDQSLSDTEIATLVSWIDAGAPKGNAADMPPPK